MSLPRIYFERLLESSPDIVVAVDRHGSIVFYNDGARQTLGYASEEVLGKPVDLVYVSRAEAKRVMGAMRSPAHGGCGKVKNFETTFRNKSGEHIPVAISGSIISDEDGTEIGSIGFAKDLREIRRHDQLVTLGEVAVTLAHEINNPLEVIANTMQLLEDFARRNATDEQLVIESERFDAVERELAKIQRIVSRVQEVAAGETYPTRQYMPGTMMTDLRTAGAETSGAGTDGSDADRVAHDDARPPTAARSLTGLTILVVDDDLGVCQSLGELLRHEGADVTVVTSAADALAVIDLQRYDLVISDVVMPDMDGYDLYMELKERRPDLPVILMTGYLYDRDHVIKRSKLAGLDTRVLFKKPLDPDKLKQIILDRCLPARDAGRERRDG